MERDQTGGMSYEEAADLVAGVGAVPAERLTARETEVLRLLAEGCTYSRVADRMGVSTHTVCTHIKNAYRKLDVHTAAAAVMRAIQFQLFSARKLLSALLIASVAALHGPQTAHAGVMGVDAAREQIVGAIDRADVRAELEARGVDAEQAKSRVALLSDAEAATLAAKLDQAPAGGADPYTIYSLVVLTVGVIVYGLVLMVKKIGEAISR